MGHEQQHVNALRLRQLVDSGVPTLELATEFGVTKSSITNWIKNDSAPYWTELACEALEKRRGKGSTEMILCEVPTHGTKTLIAVIEALSGKLHIVRTL